MSKLPVTILRAYHRIFDFGLERALEFNAITEASLESKSRTLKNKSNYVTSGEEAEELSIRHDLYAEHFPQHLRHSSFLSTWGMFENLLSDLCRRHSVSFGTKFDDSGISSAFKYLKKKMGVDLSALPYADQIDDLRTIRNHLVHRGPSVRLQMSLSTEYQKKTLETQICINRINGIGVEDNFITMHPSFNSQVIKTIRSHIKLMFAKFR